MCSGGDGAEGGPGWAYLARGGSWLAEDRKLSNSKRSKRVGAKDAPAGEGGEGGALNAMPGPKHVTARRDENASGTGALLGRQEKPASLPGATSASCDGDGAGGNRLAAGF